MNRIILISEEERSKILSLHENRKRQEWGMLFEADTSKTVTAYGTVEACKAAYNTEYLSGIAQKVTGQNWKVIQKKYLEAKCNGKTPCDTGAVSNKNLAMEICEGTFTTDGAVAATTQTTGSATGTTFYIDGKPQVLATDKEINDMIAAKKITLDTNVYKYPEIPAPTPIKDLKDDNPIKKTLTGEILKVAPELQQTMSMFILDTKGQRQGPFDAVALEKQIVTDKTITKDTKVWNGTDWVPASQVKELQQFFEKLGPTAPEVKSEFKTTGIPELDAWLQGPIGSVWDKMEEGKLKEKSLDTYKRQDPQLKAIMDKIGEGKMRDALGTKRNNMLTRGFANIRKAGVEALGGTVKDQR